MNPRRKKRLTIILAITLGLATVSGLVLYALSQNIDLFYTPSELVEGKGPDKIKPEEGQRLRIGGLVVPGSVQRDPQSLKVAFKLVDNGGHLVTVEYDGILPDLFREGQGRSHRHPEGCHYSRGLRGAGQTMKNICRLKWPMPPTACTSSRNIPRRS